MTAFLLTVLTSLSAQTERTVIVEHFTNTRCGICSNRNPGFYENLNNHPNVLHLSVHPSAPYSTCLLNQNNPAENDARTNYYGIYGSTPRLAVQGNNISSSTNYGDPELFAPYLNQTSPIRMEFTASLEAETGLQVTVELTTEEANDLGELELFVALAEDTVFYDAPNGEDEHYDVYRKNLSEGNNTVQIPAATGETVTMTYQYAYDPATSEWAEDQLSVFAILQDAETKEVIQAGKISNESFGVSSVQSLPVLENVRISPNPTRDVLRITLEDDAETTAEVTDITGKIVRSVVFRESAVLRLANLPQGVYFVTLLNENGGKTEKVIKE